MDVIRFFEILKMFHFRMDGWDGMDGRDGMGWDGISKVSFNFLHNLYVNI